MDRETTLIIAGAVIVLTLIGGLYLSPGKSSPAAPGARAHATYEPNDIRYKLQQEEEAYAKKHKGQKPPPPEAENPAAGSDNEAPANDEAAEEPEIE